MKLFSKLIFKEAQLGFSMIEILVSVSIFVLLSIVSINMFFRTSIGSTQDNTTRSLKQTGDHIITVISDSLRSSGGLLPNNDEETCQEDMNSININNLDKTANELWSVSAPSQGNSQILVNTQPITSTDINVEEFNIDCNQDPNSGVIFVKVRFILSKKSGSFDRQNDEEKSIREIFETGVTIRNR